MGTYCKTIVFLEYCILDGAWRSVEFEPHEQFLEKNSLGVMLVKALTVPGTVQRLLAHHLESTNDPEWASLSVDGDGITKMNLLQIRNTRVVAL